MTASIDLAALRERVRDALTMVRVAEHDGLQLKMTGQDRASCCCPFHAEKHASFVCGGAANKRDRYHCFGCGEDGDIFDYWQKRRGVDHVEAIKQLAGLAGLHVGEITFERPKAGAVRQPERRLGDGDDAAAKPSLPPLYKPSRAACEAIAAGRGLDPAAVWIAARVFGRVAYSPWPLFKRRSGKWMPRCDRHGYTCYLNESDCVPVTAFPSWAAIDQTLNVAEFRKLDNGLYTRADGGEIKVWSTKGKPWPLGALQIKNTKCVLLVEGGPDMLAAYHFLKIWRMLDKVTVVCMLGAGNRIREDALEYFKGCRVRIMVDADTPKDDPDKKKRKLVGLEAAARWQGQLTDAGAAVATFYVGDLYEPEDVAAWHEGTLKAADVRIEEAGYKLPDGKPAKDTNDLAKCAEDVWRCDDVKRAFTMWDF